MIFCALYVSSQLALSIRGLRDPGRHRFSWGMYAVSSSLPKIDIVYARSVDEDVAGRFAACCRPEIDYEALLPRYICAVVPSAEALHVEGRVYPCTR